MTEQSLGKILRRFRDRKRWTLKQMSAESGIAFSTLSKIENDRASLTYERLQEVSRRLKISVSDLLSAGGLTPSDKGDGRKSVSGVDQALRVNTAHYDYLYLHTDLRQKQMIPDVIRIRAKSLEEFGDLNRHEGEEFNFVIQGQVIVYTEFYEPIIINEGESIYLDSRMGHAFVAGPECEVATMVGVMYNPQEGAVKSLIEMVGERTTILSSGDTYDRHEDGTTPISWGLFAPSASRA
jgi:transcriptional regulator with XRE-family HTH domain